mmetsp:Transcript_50051/g.86072  ORF Transcript_50051/g.86072 Transcript_50051/m.86072 type:complete len:603 (+) Transcript_50051:85-1893(+)|eukprot:CAMPEP_0194576770 /NCGR_PEP_ID=MMETSP0292-20121207/11784_1 /TAXON_ID=39354 /ORGANISM="Heterosigma akashiwo, Strain CCMP2393" /LENGTH=602 /DNA_ID=CAMNT_0039428949 /DNA_START=82 /DNA_END=1890 /DNA_ORIENTATION=+
MNNPPSAGMASSEEQLTLLPKVQDLSKSSTRSGAKLQYLTAAALTVALFFAVAYSGPASKLRTRFWNQQTELEIRAQKLPNIVFLLVDDQGFNDIGYNSNDMHLTPFLDSLAEDGIKLDRYYTMYTCTPARASILTGKHAIKTGMQYQVLHESAPWGLPLDNVLLPQALKTVGNYRTHHVGKWHLGFYNELYLPHMRGFDTSYGFYAGQEHYYDHNILLTDEPYMDWSFNGEPSPEVLGTHSIELMEKRVNEIIQEASEGEDPLFLYYAHQAIHYPLDGVPDHYLNDEANAELDRLQFEERQGTGELSAGLDVSIKNMVNTLKETGMWENTILIVASDNGGCAGHGGSNWPLRGGKNSVWEGGVRVPAFIHSPMIPQSARNQVFEGYFHTSDWFSTIFSMARLEKWPGVEDLDSVDQWAAISNREIEGERNTILHNIEWNYAAGKTDFRAAVTVGELKLVYGETWDETYDPKIGEGDGVSYSICAKPFSRGTKTTWVFNIQDDPREDTELSEEISDDDLHKLWLKVDHLNDDVMVEPAFQKDSWDLGCYQAWKDAGNFLVPWHDSPVLFEDGEDGQDPLRDQEPAKYDGGDAHSDLYFDPDP